MAMSEATVATTTAPQRLPQAARERTVAAAEAKAGIPIAPCGVLMVLDGLGGTGRINRSQQWNGLTAKA